MTPNEYQNRANALEAAPTDEVKDRLVSTARWLDVHFNNVDTYGNKVDDIKKFVFYNRQNDAAKREPAPFGTHGANERLREQAGLVHAVMGIASEAAELISAVMDHISNGTPLDKVNLLEEAGDLDWYKVLLLKYAGYTNEQCQERNMQKLEGIRYKSGFSEDAANNRDLETERKILQDGQAVEIADT